MATTTNTKPIYNLPDDAVWFITGCSSGVGLRLAQLIAAHPTHRLVATARNAARLEGLLPIHARVLTIELDVTDPVSSTNAMSTVLSHPHFGRVDVLVNNAGWGLSGDTETSLALDRPTAASFDPSLPIDNAHTQARRLLETNFWGAAQLTLHAMRIMRETNALPTAGGRQGGLVIQVSTMGGFMGYAGLAWYNASKFALEGFTESVSREVRPEWNIHFTIMEPGGIDTPLMGSNMQHLPPHPAYQAPDTPARLLAAYGEDPQVIKTFSKPEDVAKAIYELSSRGKRIPIRVPLGSVSWKVLRGEIDSMAGEFDEVKELSISVDSDLPDRADDAKKVQKFAENIIL
ncbi:NAD(P)-binding protein [Cryphonectria parasitica EP155]|uniref:NAD(P)-binding protein n=1 Tax=Cryphonectria parasitica (strain ATCC 38755 / EP155) TaxID=660469 RepID=A0A9P4Y5L6_CRYP1|nr:NAD(P)-binding protein [Cryphonectria parasitica EP155]KAF3766973.1 NAD(P)-binding protein [Cryphonectria parasitica EP155]